ncbi:protein FAM183A [Rhinatrema bivittatum]|uniref:protein FAM183A n=1 Tax=Rhinatrema bivittatum TaxID=194408 RepID=UPI00112C3B85|nr:protein FAM183A [Rhinatrema bivittatum]XP_029474019.1 protein FAM183A [Rhinatrema bivittatum]
MTARPAAGAREKAEKDEVHQLAIHRETIRKELQCQKLLTEYKINPFRKVHAVTGKPMSWHDNLEETADANFLSVIHHVALEPTKKYTEPQTTSQEIGWITAPLISLDHTDCRFNFHRHKTEITAYMEAAWRQKEQSMNMQ